MPLLMFFFFFFFLVVCAWLGSVDSLVNYDLKIQHLEKVISQGVNKVVMEHLMKLYKELCWVTSYLLTMVTTAFVLLGLYNSHLRSSK